MELGVLLLLGVLVILVVKLFSSSSSKRIEGIPQVKGALPLVGCALTLDKLRFDQTLLAWAKELGPVYQVRMFHQNWVVVSGYDEMYEMLVTKGQAFSGRQIQFKFGTVTHAPKDIVHGDPTMPHWLPLRKAAHRGIRHYGKGMTRLESTLADVASDFVAKITSYDGKVVDLKDDIYNFVIKVAVSMFSGRKVTDEGDKMLADMKMLDHLLSDSLTLEGLELDFYPWLRHFGHPTYKIIKKFCMLRDQLWDDMEEYSKQTYTSDGEAACIMHSITQLLDSRSQYYEPDLDKEHARGLFSDLIIASISTTTNFTYALPNILLHNPRVLRRIQQEVDDVIGPDRRPSIFDRDAMPYSVATILELLRYASLVISVPHLTLENTTIGGHPLPAGTIIFQLIPAIMLDKFWGDPEVFRPERFLDDDTGALLPGDHPNRKHMLEFGAGPRMCVGEAFAQKRMFIFLTSLLQAFDLQPGNDPLVPCDYSSFVMKGLLCQRPYSVKLTARKRN